MERLDDDTQRFRSLAGRILDRAPDPLLEAIARDAADASGAAVAVVSIVLEHTVMFRAHHGLPTDLAAASGVDRDAAPCTVVVHDRAPFVLGLHADEPASLAMVLGTRAYAGVPVRIHNVVVGAVGVFGDGFDGDIVAALEPIARRAGARLEDLAQPTRRLPRLRSRAGSPAFGEVQSAMAPLRDDAIYARVLAADAAPIARLAAAGVDDGRVRPLLDGAFQASLELTHVLTDLERASRRVEDELALVEAAVEEIPGPSELADVVAFADGLARHATHRAGGVVWENAGPQLQDVTLRATRTVAAGVLAAALADVAHRQTVDQGVLVDVSIDPQAVTMSLLAPELSDDDAADCAATVTELLGPHPNVRVDAVSNVVVVRFTRDWDA